MPISNSAELRSAISDFLNRDDLTPMITTFISLGEANIARDLRHMLQEKRVIATLDERYENLPSDFLEMRRITLDDGTVLRPMSGDEMGRLRFKNNDAAGKSMYYYITADQIEFYPTPDGSNNVIILYYGQIPTLAKDNDSTNWLVEQYPDVYLYASLLHTAPYLRDDPRIAVWAGLYQSAIDKLNSTSRSAQYSGGTLVLRS